MEKIASMGVIGKSGKVYAFDFYPADAAFEALGAVYVITRRVSHPEGIGGGHSFIYIGETGDLSSAFSAHGKRGCFEKLRANSIGIHLDESEESRRSKEADLLLGNDWPCKD